VDVTNFVNIALKTMTISGLVAGFFLIALQILIRKLEREEDCRQQR